MRVKSWNQHYKTEPSLERMLRNATTHSGMLRELLGHSRILEIGTGTGTLSTLLSCLGRYLVTVDNNVQVLRTAMPFLLSHGSVRPVVGDAFRLPFLGDSFDAAFSQGLLEHFRDEDIRLLVTEQLRVARHAYISVPSLFYPHFWHAGPGLIGDERFLSLGMWRRCLSDFSVTGSYYADFKHLTVAGWNLPWPAHIFLRVGRASGN